ncbi:MAG: hypothetical protein R3194_08640 [Limnobacter sp.]|nr:hypothetical protein [Limnobacter sp.]
MRNDHDKKTSLAFLGILVAGLLALAAQFYANRNEPSFTAEGVVEVYVPVQLLDDPKVNQRAEILSERLANLFQQKELAERTLSVLGDLYEPESGLGREQGGEPLTSQNFWRLPGESEEETVVALMAAIQSIPVPDTNLVKVKLETPRDRELNEVLLTYTELFIQDQNSAVNDEAFFDAQAERQRLKAQLDEALKSAKKTQPKPQQAQTRTVTRRTEPPPTLTRELRIVQKRINLLQTQIQSEPAGSPIALLAKTEMQDLQAQERTLKEKIKNATVLETVVLPAKPAPKPQKPASKTEISEQAEQLMRDLDALSHDIQEMKLELVQYRWYQKPE